MWLYGSGFPKSHNISLDIDKLNGCENRGHRIATANRYHPDGTLEPNGEHLEEYKAKTEEGKKWEGWGTALKPAYEPIIVARKPIEESVAKNVLKYGVGGINIDECRVAPTGEDIGRNNHTNPFSSGRRMSISNTPAQDSSGRYEGRFPANVITDGSEEVVKDMPNSKGSQGIPFEKGSYKDENNIFNRGNYIPYNDEGSVSRYFYSAKASKKDRDEGLDMFEDKQKIEYCLDYDNGVKRSEGKTCKNFHPTVKPIELMQYLVRLVSPKGSTILDCFMGSGSTGKAVMFENRERQANYHFVGIELTDEYLPICQARIDYALNKYEYDEKKEIQEKHERGEVDLFDFNWDE